MSPTTSFLIFIFSFLSVIAIPIVIVETFSDYIFMKHVHVSSGQLKDCEISLKLLTIGLIKRQRSMKIAICQDLSTTSRMFRDSGVHLMIKPDIIMSIPVLLCVFAFIVGVVVRLIAGSREYNLQELVSRMYGRPYAGYQVERMDPTVSLQVIAYTFGIWARRYHKAENQVLSWEQDWKWLKCFGGGDQYFLDYGECWEMWLKGYLS